MFIRSYIRWKNAVISHNGINIYQLQQAAIREIPAEAYREAGISYPKFFKMDILSRVAFIAAELLDIPHDNIPDKTKVGTVISTSSGCIDVDKKFEESRQKIASPALFVYTLPNIMLGELCIRHGFKGAQVCFIEEHPAPSDTFFHVNDLMTRQRADACLCGHIDASEESIDASLIWVTRESGPLAFTEEQLKNIYQGA